jgi:hypothetical protein
MLFVNKKCRVNKLNKTEILANELWLGSADYGFGFWVRFGIEYLRNLLPRWVRKLEKFYSGIRT